MALEQRMEMDANGQGASEEQKPVNHCECAEHDNKPHAITEKWSCEDVFGSFQGKLVFLEDENAPTIDEWPQA